MEEKRIPLEIENSIVSRIVKKILDCVMTVKQIEDNCEFSLDMKEKTKIFMLQVMRVIIYLIFFIELSPCVKEISSCLMLELQMPTFLKPVYYIISFQVLDFVLNDLGIL